MITLNSRLRNILFIVCFILLIPLIAMQFTAEVNWSPFDFIIMGIMLFTTGFAIDFVLQKVKRKSHRIVLCVILLATFFLIWAELAVGIFGTPFAGS